MQFRRPTADEARLIRELARLAKIESLDTWLRTLRVRDLDDGGMGSIEIDSPGHSERSVRKATVCRAAVQFTDADGIEVIASLNARDDGEPFEVDIWKTDFSRLVRIPHQFRRVDE